MAFMKALFGTGEAREATKKGARAYDELAARRKASAQKGGARRVASVTKSPKAESRKPKAETRTRNPAPEIPNTPDHPLELLEKPSTLTPNPLA